MDNKLKEFFDKKYTYAVVGASNNINKYGYKIVKALVDAGFNVIPVNPKEDMICGVKCYASLLAVSEKVDIVDFVVPPGITLKELESVKIKEIKKVWFQHRSYDYKCEGFCKKNHIRYVTQDCLYEQVIKNFE